MQKTHGVSFAREFEEECRRTGRVRVKKKCSRCDKYFIPVNLAKKTCPKCIIKYDGKD